MNKDSIYRIIGYHGEYSDSVKKALKKLLKENHPDRNGNVEIFKIINEVKNELETDKVSFQYAKVKNNEVNTYSDIDIDYCQKMSEKIKKDLNSLERKIVSKKEELKEINNKYRMLYENSFEEQKYLINNNKAALSLKKIKTRSILLLIIITIIFIVAIINNNLLLFSLFGLMCFIFIFIIIKYFNIMNSIAKNNEKNLNKYVKITSKLHFIMEKRDSLSIELWNLEREKTSMENDLRFYSNLLKK